MTDTTTGELNTVAELIDEGYYCPPVHMKWDKDGRVKYTPRQWEKDLVQYDLTMTQGVYPDGKLGPLHVKIKVDNSKNIIHSRFEILDL
jgi:hypothetical protein